MMGNSKSIQLPYAVNVEKKLVHIKDAKNGLACNCFCPSCGQPLIAKNNGKIKIPHFAHKSDFNCSTALQSMLHYLAKEIFLETRQFVFTKADGRNMRYNVTAVFLENKIDNIIPDVILNCDGKFFFVEIFVSHAIDDEKKNKIEEMGVSTVEYDLSKLPRDIDKDSLKNILFSNPKIRWSYDADIKRIENKKKFLFENGEKIKPEHGFIDCQFAPPRIRKIPYTGIFSIERYRVTEEFCSDCLFYSGKNESNEAFCGKQFSQSQDFDFATIIGKDIVMTDRQTENYINKFVARANKVVI